jgi:hypothetical protein
MLNFSLVCYCPAVWTALKIWLAVKIPRISKVPIEKVFRVDSQTIKYLEATHQTEYPTFRA